MKRVVSPFGVRTALITGLVVLVLTPVAALASRYACGGSISAPSSARQGDSFIFTATAVEGNYGDQFEVWLFGGEGGSFLGVGTLPDNGSFDVSVTVPASFSTGGATVVMDMASPSTCDYGSGITILSKLTSINPNITITIPPALTTTTAAQQATTTTAAPQSTSTTTASSTTSTVPVSTSTSTEVPAETTTSAGAETTTSVAAETTIPDSTSTSLVAAAPLANSSGGQPWSAWIAGGLVGLTVGAAGMLTAIRKGVLKI